MQKWPVFKGLTHIVSLLNHTKNLPVLQHGKCMICDSVQPQKTNAADPGRCDRTNRDWACFLSLQTGEGDLGLLEVEINLSDP